MFQATKVTAKGVQQDPTTRHIPGLATEPDFDLTSK